MYNIYILPNVCIKLAHIFFLTHDRESLAVLANYLASRSLLCVHCFFIFFAIALALSSFFIFCSILIKKI